MPCMKDTVSDKQIDICKAFPAYAEDHLEEVVDKNFDKAVDPSITVSRAGSGLRVDISVQPGRRILAQSSGEAKTADPALEWIAKRLRDHHRKEKSAAKQYTVNMHRFVIAPPSDDGEDAFDAVVGNNIFIIAEKTGEIETPPVSEPVMRMDLADRAGNVFRNTGNGRVNMVYCRRDGIISWVQREVPGDAA